MQQKEPVCSVCIANYNGVQILAECIDSVLAQQFAHGVEILVHDDASTDGSVAWLAQHYPQVQVIASAENVGFCVANNRLADIARGRYLLFLNNDAALFPDALQSLYTAAEASPLPTILGLPQYDAQSGELIDRGSLFDPFLNPIPNLDAAREEVGMVIGACLWIGRDHWRRIGGFPSWFHTLAEDMYLCLVARLWGGQIRVLPKSGFRHHVGYSLGGGKVQAARLASRYARRARSERNKTFSMVLTYPPPWLWLLLPIHLGLLLVEGLILSLLKNDLRPLWEIYGPVPAALWASRRRLRAERRRIQAVATGREMGFWKTFSWWPHKLRLLWRHGVPEIRA